MSSINQDPFEEFEFRPINEGLGFHRKPKTASTTSQMKTSVSSSQTFMANTMSSFAAPLPRPEAAAPRPSFHIPVIEDDSIAKAQTAVNEILKNLNQKRQMDFIHETEKQRTEMKKSKPLFFAATLDAMLILASFLMSMIIMLTVTKVDLVMNLSNPGTDHSVYIATLGLFLAITFIYMVVNRAFMGFTPGEWAFDQTCKPATSSSSLSYIPRLAFRTIMVMLTGFVVMPLLSYLLNKDLSGQISGVVLFKKAQA